MAHGDKTKGKSQRKAPDFPGPSKIATIIFWAIIAFVVVYAFKSEVRHQGCYTDRQKLCISPFYRTAPEDGDDANTLLQRVENGVRLPEESVFWRKNLLISILVSIVVPVVAFRRFPTPIEFTIGVAVIYVILASIQNWTEMHIWYRVREQQLRTVNQLRVNLGILQPSSKPGLYGPNESVGFVY